jgi:hypothetical protein
MKTLRVFSANRCHVKQESLACGIASQSRKPLGSRMMMYARLASRKGMISRKGTMSLRQCWLRRRQSKPQSATGEELKRWQNGGLKFSNQTGEVNSSVPYQAKERRSSVRICSPSVSGSMQSKETFSTYISVESRAAA